MLVMVVIWLPVLVLLADVRDRRRATGSSTSATFRCRPTRRRSRPRRSSASRAPTSRSSTQAAELLAAAQYNAQIGGTAAAQRAHARQLVDLLQPVVADRRHRRSTGGRRARPRWSTSR